MVPHRAVISPASSPSHDGARPAALSSLWHEEPGVFALQELGWVAEQARRRVHLEVGWPSMPALLRDPHLRDEAFRRLAVHPRLLGRVTSLLGGAAEIAGSALFAGDAIRLPDAFLSAAILVVIPLGTSPSLGAIGYGTRVPEGVLHDWPFVVAMRPAATPEAAQSAIDDDALWPDAASVAG